MSIDLIIILVYFVTVMTVAVRGRVKGAVTAEDFFISSRSLPWYSVAASTIATNIHAGHFLGVAGAAYAYGLAQANFEINAVIGLLLAAFVFLPFYMKHRVITITQFFEKKFGPRVATAYSVLFMVLYGTLYIGTQTHLYAIQADGKSDTE